MSDPQDDIRRWMKDELANAGRGSKGRLAKHLGVRPDAITRMLNTEPGKEQRRGGSSAEPPSSSPEECGWQGDVWQLTFFARARAGCRARGWQEGGGAAPKGAVLLELDERGAARQPLEQLRIGARSSAGGAELLDPVPLRSTSSGLGPLDQHPRCLVAPLTSAHNYPATTLQRPAPYVL